MVSPEQNLDKGDTPGKPRELTLEEREKEGEKRWRWCRVCERYHVVREKK